MKSCVLVLLTLVAGAARAEDVPCARVTSKSGATVTYLSRPDPMGDGPIWFGIAGGDRIVDGCALEVRRKVHNDAPRCSLELSKSGRYAVARNWGFVAQIIDLVAMRCPFPSNEPLDAAGLRTRSAKLASWLER